jgi:hypothetical protein
VSAKRIAVEVVIDLRRRLDQLPSRSAERRDIVRQAAEPYGVSESTLYQFDLSPSELKDLEEALWYDPSTERPILMLYSVVDDRSGVCYQEYRNVMART